MVLVSSKRNVFAAGLEWKHDQYIIFLCALLYHPRPGGHHSLPGHRHRSQHCPALLIPSHHQQQQCDLLLPPQQQQLHHPSRRLSGIHHARGEVALTWLGLSTPGKTHTHTCLGKTHTLSQRGQNKHKTPDSRESTNIFMSTNKHKTLNITILCSCCGFLIRWKTNKPWKQS